MRELMLLYVAPEDFDPTGWWWSEKLDGVRAFWDGAGGLWSRSGLRFRPPAEWVAGLPLGVELDGELWGGRGTYQATKAAVQRKTPRPEEWAGIRLRPFDAPAAPGGFEERLRVAARAVVGSPVAEAVPHWPVRSRGHADQVYREVLAGGGEGIVYRRPGAPYEGGRSRFALKRKPGKG